MIKLLLTIVALALLDLVTCQVAFDGRFFPVDGSQSLQSLPTAVSWPASQITASFVGSSTVTAIVKDLTYSSEVDVGLLPVGISVLVDGAGEATFTSSNGLFYFTIGNLPATGATVSLIKEDEPAVGSLEFLGFALDDTPTARFLPVPEASDRRIEFVGDSITVGYGNVGNDASCTSKACAGTFCKITSASQSFASLTAAHLESSFHVVAWSGAGLTRNPEPPAAQQVNPAYGVPPPNLPEFYTRADGSNPTSVWDYSQYIPQVVVLAIGVNDFLDSSSYPEIGAWTAVYMGALNVLTATYPGVKIVMVQWPLEMLTAYQPGSTSINQGADIIAPANYPVYQNFHQTAYNQAQAAGLKNVVYFEPTAAVGAFLRGCVGHPSVQTHQAIAAELISFLAGIIG